MKTKHLFVLLLACSLIFSACAASKPAAETQTPTVTEETTPETVSTVPETTVPETTAAPLAEAAEPLPVVTAPQKTVTVSTVDEFLAALESDTEIILNASYFDLSTATGFGTASGQHYYWEEVYDGHQLTICDVSNLTIRAEGEDITAHTVSARPRYAHVLNFENCASITVEGFTAGHTIEPGSCSGGVIGFRGCEDILINHCGLYGCGVVGVWAEQSQRILVTNCDIYECSWGGVYMVACREVSFNGNTIRDLGQTFDGEFWPGTAFMLHDTTDITINGEKMINNYIGE